MPTNLYGLNDNYDLEKSHVLPALIRKFHEAKTNNAPEVIIWGSGKPMREFLFSDDLAEAALKLMLEYNDEKFVNIGTGHDLSILELAQMIQKIIGYNGKLVFDKTKPDGTPRKLMDVSFLNSLGWKYKTELEDGIKIAYEDFLKKQI